MTLATWFASQPFLYAFVSSVLITAAMYAYTASLHVTPDEIKKTTCKTAVITLGVNLLLAYFVSSGLREPVLHEPFARPIATSPVT